MFQSRREHGARRPSAVLSSENVEKQPPGESDGGKSVARPFIFGVQFLVDGKNISPAVADAPIGNRFFALSFNQRHKRTKIGRIYIAEHF
jgi:hypothetical protein